MVLRNDISRTERTFLGHPRGLATLFLTEAWERFSYYGMRAVLLYYLYDHVANGGLGLSTATAASIVSVYGAAVYMSGVLGGWLADRVLGSRLAILSGGLLIMGGHIALAIPGGLAMFFTSMALIVLGTGLLKTNASSVLGELYADQDSRRDAGFSLFYMGINLGAFIAPYVVGTLGQTVGYHVGFAAAAVGMAFGIVQYVLGARWLGNAGKRVPHPLHGTELRKALGRIALCLAGLAAVTLIFFRITGFAVDGIVNLISVLAILVPLAYFVVLLRSKRISGVERSRVRAFVPLFVAAVAFWIVDEQGATVLATFADKRTDRVIGGFEIPASWFQSINPIATLIWAPVLAFLWMKLGSRQPRTPTKFAIGLALTGMSFVIMAIPGLLHGTRAPASPFWLLASFIVLLAGAVCLSPVGLAVTTKLAPRAYAAQLMSLWMMSDSAAQGINAQLVKLYSPETEIGYFLAHGAGELLIAAGMLAIGGWVHRNMAGVN
ncbi:oligopeptide:H+ symporter [Sciscionella sediminilitoris]|uniref:oligopeptide:H+ symporter n=1 Tax=Sciscionella sediminilitoris TaxID=1445613 RepID=UPI0004DF2EED